MGLRGLHSIKFGRKAQLRTRRIPRAEAAATSDLPGANGRRPAATPEEPSDVARRMRAYRRRMSRGGAVVQVELDWADVEMLIEAKTLSPRLDLYSRQEVAVALKAFLKLSRVA
jgi:hypothetical protein